MNWCPGHPYEKDAKTFNLALLFLAKMFSQDTMTAVCVCFRHDIVYRSMHTVVFCLTYIATISRRPHIVLYVQM